MDGLQVTREGPSSVRAIRRINNNAAICEDGKGHQLVALGRGIGFGQLPREVPLADVRRTFYGIDPKYLPLIEELDPEVLEFAAQLAEVARTSISSELSPNLPITLADHIEFAIKRTREHMVVQTPLAYDVEQNFLIQYKLGGLRPMASTRPSRCACPVTRLWASRSPS